MAKYHENIELNSGDRPQPIDTTVFFNKPGNSYNLTTNGSGRAESTMFERNWNKLQLVVWKEVLTLWRNPSRTLGDVLVPVAIISMFLTYRVRDWGMGETHYDPFDLSSFNRSGVLANNAPSEWRLAYISNGPVYENIIKGVSKNLGFDEPLAVLNSAEMESAIMKRKLLAGVVFHTDQTQNINELPRHLNYSLRFPSELRSIAPGIRSSVSWFTNMIYPRDLSRRNARAQDHDSYGSAPCYKSEGFLAIQNAIAATYISILGNTKMPDIQVQRFPYPPARKFLTIETPYLSFLILICFTYYCVSFVYHITVEKESQLKEIMKIMGLPTWLHWIGWFIRLFIMLLIVSILVALVFTIPWSKRKETTSFFELTDRLPLWAFLFTYCIATITFSFMLSTFFSKENKAIMFAALVWFISFAPYALYRESFNKLSPIAQVVSCLLSNSAMGYGMQLITNLELDGTGLQWSNLWDPVSHNDTLTVGKLMCIMLVDAVIYLVIALYVDKVFPGDYGLPEKWFFPLSKDFWLGGPREKESSRDYPDSKNFNFESDPSNRSPEVRMENLKKVFDNNVIAVHDFTMNLYTNQIAVLLGHSGAGKTTLLSMLTGILPPTSGTAVINGYDIRKNIHGARESIGFCPQEDVLIDNLTVKEQIIFYCGMKGLGRVAAEQEVAKYDNLLGFKYVLNTEAYKLNNTMKRKLCVAVAFCAGSKVILCDEPTIGLDPTAKHELWETIQNDRKGRTVLLSTQSIYEATVLSDRIAIMAEGRLKSCGSSLFVNKRYGTGYRLVCMKDNHCSSEAVTEVLRRHIANIEVESETDTELVYKLPDNQEDTLQNMLADLERGGEKLGLNSSGITLTTLEDVFLKIGADPTAFDESTEDFQDSSTLAKREKHVEEHRLLETETGGESLVLVKGLRLILNQWLAMFKKRYIHMKRNWWLLVVQIILPVLLLGLLVYSANETVADNQSALNISPSPYQNPVAILEKPKLSDSVRHRIAAEYVNSPPHLKVIPVEDEMQAFYFAHAKTDFYEMQRGYLAGATMNETITAWFNNIPYHTAPLSLNLVHNAIVRALVSPDCSIEVINDPMPYASLTESGSGRKSRSRAFYAILAIALAMLIVSACYILFYIEERRCKAKLLQFISGVGVFTFWVSALLWDLLMFLIPTLVIILVLAIMQIETMSTTAELTWIFIVLMCFGLAMLPMTYLFSLRFSFPSTGFNAMALFNVVSGLVLYYLTSSLNADNVFLIYDVLYRIEHLFPHFTLLSSLIGLSNGALKRQACGDNKSCEINVLQSGIGENLLSILIVGGVCFLVLLVFETGLLRGIISTIRQLLKENSPQRSQSTVVDEDVLKEKNKVNVMSMNDLSSRSLVIKNLTKFYDTFLAVNQVSVTVEEAECFGLLGANGGGKTSIFKMLVGDTQISNGSAYLRGVDLKTNVRKTYQKIGYCPQHDGLLNDLTGRETVEISCMLRGIPSSDTENVLMRLARDLQFDKHINEKISTYSFGNKRKLSTALALIGEPEVIYLDEPTNGMDINAKYRVWKIVSKLRSKGKSIVLTSRSMEECEALCTRLAIMVNGEFKCLGSKQQLEEKFAQGYLVKIKVKQSVEVDLTSSQSNYANVRALKEYIATHFPGASLKEETQGQLTYHVPASVALKWSIMFGLLENAKRNLQIDDYSISQISLEQVYLSLAGLQKTQDEGIENESMSLGARLRALCSK